MDRVLVWLETRFGMQEMGVWLSIDTFKLAITSVSGFCQGIAENQWDASSRLVNQFSALPMGWPFPAGCLSARHLSYLAFFLLFLSTIVAGYVFPSLRGLSTAATYPRWHLPKVAKLASECDTEWWLFQHVAPGGAMLQDEQGQHH